MRMEKHVEITVSLGDASKSGEPSYFREHEMDVLFSLPENTKPISVMESGSASEVQWQCDPESSSLLYRLPAFGVRNHRYFVIQLDEQQ